MPDTITLTIKEVREARKDLGVIFCNQFLAYREIAQCKYHAKTMPACRLCKKLTEFAKEGEDE